jgi:hypothetical protein
MFGLGTQEMVLLFGGLGLGMTLALVVIVRAYWREAPQPYSDDEGR